MDTVAIGGSITLNAVFPAVPTNPQILITDNNGRTVMTDTPTSDGGGAYHYTYTVPVNTGVGSGVGTWLIQWSGTLPGGLVQTTEQFLVTAGVVAGSTCRWVSISDAQKITGNANLTDAMLLSAAGEIYDEMRWIPVFGLDFRYNDYWGRPNHRKIALGQAIAWQAHFRYSNPIDVNQTEQSISQEKIGDKQVWYGGSGQVADVGGIPQKVKRILRQHGLYRLMGETGHFGGDQERDFDDGPIIRIG